jgi:hypothetical protein
VNIQITALCFMYGEHRSGRASDIDHETCFHSCTSVQ